MTKTLRVPWVAAEFAGLAEATTLEAVEPPIEYEFIITLKDGSHTRHDPSDVIVRPEYVRVNGPRPREYTRYPITSINWFGLQEKTKIQSSEGDAA